MIIVYLAYGVTVPGSKPMVFETVEGKPAVAAGLLPGDELLEIDGQKVDQVDQVKPIINKSMGRPIAVHVMREGQSKTFTVKAELDKGEYLIGIKVDPKPESQPAPFGRCVIEGLRFPYDYSRFILHGFGEIFAGRQKAEFSGPIGIVKVMKKQIEGGLKASLSIIAIISVYLGLFNLLPLPALDGGRIVFLALELISRRRVNQRIEQTVHMVGMFVLLGFLVYVTVGNDLSLGRLFKH
jgi:regulator of sigma E protease